MCYKNKIMKKKKKEILEQIYIWLLIQKYIKCPFLHQLYTTKYKHIYS